MESRGRQVRTRGAARRARGVRTRGAPRLDFEVPVALAPVAGPSGLGPRPIPRLDSIDPNPFYVTLLGTGLLIIGVAWSLLHAAPMRVGRVVVVLFNAPQSFDWMKIISIEFPRVVPLALPLHERRKRAWDPERSVAQPLVKQPQVVEMERSQMVELDQPQVEQQLVEVEVVRLDDEQQALSSAPVAYPSTSALFLECGGSSTASTPTGSAKRTRHLPLKDHDIERFQHYGSESSDSEEDDNNYVSQLLSRVYLLSQDTPIDPEPAHNAIVPPPEPVPEPAADCLEPEHAVCLLPAVDPTVTPSGSSEPMRPVGLFEFEWSSFPDPPIPSRERREAFRPKNVGPTSPDQDPYRIFTEIWDEPIMDHIVKETNRFAEDLASVRMDGGSLGPWSRINYWRDTCIAELYIYFAIVLAMGIVIKSKIDEYWTGSGTIFTTPGFRAAMTLKRFQLLSTCLHFNDNMSLNREALSPAEAKLYKIQPIINHLNKKFQAMYTLEQNIAVDESLLQWKGWLSINQFIANKVAKVGIKTYELCESQSGYLWRFIVHAHKRHIPLAQHQSPLDAATPSIVLELLRGLEGMGYTVWMDNYYNSPALARSLKSIGFDVAGTLRTNRQFVPQQLKELTKASMRPGEITGFTSSDVDLLVWRDQNRIATISTYHGNTCSVLDNKVKPCVILDYNKMMGGVDKKDQLLAMYPIERKRHRVWYKKFFRRLLNVSVLNSYIIANKSSPNHLDHRTFRVNLVNAILSRHGTVIREAPVALTNDVFEVKTHCPMEYPFGATNRRLRRKCNVCTSLTHFYCDGCDKAVCVGPCFRSFHS